MSAFGGTSRHDFLHRKCPLLTQSGHTRAPEVRSRVSVRWRRLFGPADTPNVHPSVKRKRQANDGNESQNDRNDKECNSIKKRGKPERRIPLPQSRPRAIKCLCRRREGQIIGLLRGIFTKSVEGARRPVNFSHCFKQQILQSGVKVVFHEQSVAGREHVDVRIGNVPAQVNETSPQHHMLQTGDLFGDRSFAPNLARQLIP
jgi:hypothetical protein